MELKDLNSDFYGNWNLEWISFFLLWFLFLSSGVVPSESEE